MTYDKKDTIESELIYEADLERLISKIQKLHSQSASICVFLGEDIDCPDNIIKLSTDQLAEITENRAKYFFILSKNTETIQKASHFLGKKNNIKVFILSDEAHQKEPVFLISPPKAGSHLLISLMTAFGYLHGGALPTTPKYGKWYNLEHDSIHTLASEFFYNRNIQGYSYGGRLSAFNNCLGVVMYRHPRDILKSRLSYYFDPERSIMGRFMEQESRIKKLEALLDPNSIFGDMGQELADFVNWIHFPNIIPVSFEEFSPIKHSKHYHLDLIWELQLALCVPGKPSEYFRQAYGKSDTFNDGAIFPDDADIQQVLPELYEKCRYYMSNLGYNDSSPYSDVIPNSRLKRTSIHDYRPKDTSIQIEALFEHNILYRNKRYYALKYGHPNETFIDEHQKDPQKYFQSDRLEETKLFLQINEVTKRTGLLDQNIQLSSLISILSDDPCEIQIIDDSGETYEFEVTSTSPMVLRIRKKNRL
ncbi:hypothetical protein [Curvivirga sp.]|uniref:hypothetical protein n=1 Tax=Curvivirga sp. TaxID=2856848 RepID=UPI003B5C5856